MSMNEMDIALPENFRNIVRLFPLPNLVLFPGVIQGLHLFEPRYRQLMVDALDSDELISMALLQPGWDQSLSDRPPVHPTVCIGKIVTHHRFDDGRYNLLLLGAQRARIVHELSDDHPYSERPYRMARVEVLTEEVGCEAEEAERIADQVLQMFRELVKWRANDDEESIESLLQQNLSLGQLLDLVSYSSDACPEHQQQVLTELNTYQRAKIVIAHLQELHSCRRPQTRSGIEDFPPRFSAN